MKETSRFCVYVSAQRFQLISRKRYTPGEDIRLDQLFAEARRDVELCGFSPQGDTAVSFAYLDDLRIGFWWKVPHDGMTWPFHVLASRRAFPQFVTFLRGQPPIKPKAEKKAPLGERLVSFLRSHPNQHFSLQKLCDTGQFGVSYTNIDNWLSDEVRKGVVQSNDLRGPAKTFWIGAEVDMP